MIIGKHFEFEAAHQLPNEECYGKCRNLHGHTYKLIVEVTGGITEKGWICNFSEIKTIVEEKVIGILDHAFLNDVIADVTTAENMLEWIRHQIQDEIELNRGTYLYCLTLYETSKSFAKLYC